MKTILICVALAGLVGCGTPEQQQNLADALQNYQDTLQMQQQQNIQQQQNLRQQMHQNRTTYCRSAPTYGGGFNTVCN